MLKLFLIAVFFIPMLVYWAARGIAKGINDVL